MVMKDYLQACTPIFGSQVSEVYFLDGFAGQGYFDDGKPGSPILSAQYAKEIYDKSRRYRLHCINVEYREDWFKQLDQATQEIAPGLVTNYLGSFSEKIPEIVDQMGRAPCFAFIDPFGIKPITLESLRPLLIRPFTDILINFNGIAVERLFGVANSGTSNSNKAAEILDEVYDDSAWRNLASPNRESLLSLYLNKITNLRGIASRHDIRTSQGTYKYSLIFASGNKLAFYIMNDIMYKVDKLYYTETKSASTTNSLQLAFDLNAYDKAQEETREQKIVSDLSKDLIEVLLSTRGRVMYWGELMFAVFKKGWFGKLKSSHYRKARNLLLTTNKIEIRKNPEDKWHKDIIIATTATSDAP